MNKIKRKTSLSLRAYCCSIFMLMFALPTLAADDSLLLPQHFTASIGGFLGASYRVELHDGKLIYSARERGEREAKTTTISPSAQQWQTFYNKLNQLKVRQWQAEYIRPDTYDGTQWSLEIAYSDGAFKARGSNLYPDENAHASEEQTDAFNQYLMAISQLINGRTFQ